MAVERDTAERERWIAVATEEHDRLLSSLEALVVADELDVSSPSLLPGWTVGHVLTHITHSGDGHLLMLEAAARGEVGRQYPGGGAQRHSDIERGATRPAEDQLADLRRSIEALEQRWATMPAWDGVGASMAGEVPICDLPFLRLREVAIHHTDLGFDYRFDDLPAVYVREEIRRMSMLWSARQPMGLGALPPRALAASPPERLAWLTGRATIEGLEPAGIY